MVIRHEGKKTHQNKQTNKKIPQNKSCQIKNSIAKGQHFANTIKTIKKKKDFTFSSVNAPLSYRTKLNKSEAVTPVLLTNLVSKQAQLVLITPKAILITLCSDC